MILQNAKQVIDTHEKMLAMWKLVPTIFQLEHVQFTEEGAIFN